MKLLKKFKTDTASYVYNAYSNQILEVGRLVYELVDRCGTVPDKEIVRQFSPRYNPDVIQASLDKIRELTMDTAPFHTKSPEKCRYHHDDATIRTQVNHSLKQLTLVVTENCNLRCRYCIYSGSYDGSRLHSARSMPLETALAAIDHLAEHSRDSDAPLAVGFYGGEPLLEFELIRQVVAYSRKRLQKPVLFTITTNGTLLSKTVFNFLREHNFSILVSMDGPEHVHDRYRRFRSNNRGSFAPVIKNLERIKKIDNEYVRSMVTLSMVLTFPVDLLELDRFVNELGIRPRISLLQTFGTSMVDERILQKGLRTRGPKELMDKFATAVIEKKFEQRPLAAEHLFTRGLYWAGLRRLHLRNRTDSFVDGCFNYKNICVPGATKLLVTCDGKFFACDRVDGIDDLCIGDISNGVDTDKVVDLVERFNRFRSESCKDCWVLRLCNMCFFSTCHFDGWNAGKADHYCDMRRREGTNALRLYCSILEKDASALDAIFSGETLQ